MKKALLIFCVIMGVNVANAEQGKAELERECLNGDADACFEVGVGICGRFSSGYSCSVTESLEYYAKACKLKHKKGCFRVGEILEGSSLYKNPQKAQEYYRKSCDMGYEPGCLKLK